MPWYSSSIVHFSTDQAQNQTVPRVLKQVEVPLQFSANTLANLNTSGHAPKTPRQSPSANPSMTQATMEDFIEGDGVGSSKTSCGAGVQSAPLDRSSAVKGFSRPCLGLTNGNRPESALTYYVNTTGIDGDGKLETAATLPQLATSLHGTGSSDSASSSFTLHSHLAYVRRKSVI